MYTVNSQDCEWAQARIDDYLDGDLSAEDGIRLVGHCSDCEICGPELDLAEAVKEGLDALPELACPDDVTDRVFARIWPDLPDTHRSVRSPRLLQFVRPVWRPATVAAAVALIALASVFVSIERNVELIDEQPPSTAEVDRALREAKFALAVIRDAGLRTGMQVRSDVSTTIVEPVRHVFADTDSNGL